MLFLHVKPLFVPQQLFAFFFFGGQGGYITPAASGIPTASERGAVLEVAHKWARWLHNPCRLGVPTALKQGAESEVAAVRNGKSYFWGPRNKAWISEWGDNIKSG